MSSDAGIPPDAPILGPEAARSIDTPALVVDLDRAERAIGAMAAFMAERGIALRPHAKTHKSLEVGRRQIAAGAAGLTVGTLGEAEVFDAGGIDDLFIAYPLIAQGPRAERLVALVDRRRARAAPGGPRLRIGLDSAVGAEALLAALGSRTDDVELLVEVDPGAHRTGVAPADAGPLAASAASRGLRVVGVFAHAAHGYAGPAARDAAADDEVRTLTEAAGSLARAGVAPSVVSAGATPTVARSARGAVTEERPGTYVFGDRQQVALGSVLADAVAAVVVTTVVSVDRSARRFVVDAGAKALGKDTASFLAGHGVIPELDGAVVVRVHDYHGVVEAASGASLPAVGQVVAVVPNHICPVFNLVDDFLVVRDGAIVDRWRVDARGRNG